MKFSPNRRVLAAAITVALALIALPSQAQKK